jgi:hypothetical protein
MLKKNTWANFQRIVEVLTHKKFSIGYAPVLRIRDVYPGSDFFPSRIPDPNCLHPGSRIRTVSIPDPGSPSKNLSYLTPKKAKKYSF